MTKPRGGGGGGGARGGSRKNANSSRASSSRSRTSAQVDAAAAAGSGQQKEQQRNEQQRQLSIPEQQRLLDVFSQALRPTLISPHLSAALQSVKRALFARDFAGAFASSTLTDGPASVPADADTDAVHSLDAYAARWSPTRALCYAAILSSPLLQKHWLTRGEAAAEAPNTQHHRRMVAIGGGAAEVVAFGSLFAGSETRAGEGADGETLKTGGSLVLVDSAPWTHVIDKLHDVMKGRGPGSDDEKKALIQPADCVDVHVSQLDILQVEEEDMQALLLPPPSTPPLITLFFTLNELFTAGGIGAAATFLLRLTAATAAAPGSLLLVVDSPGSYAETTVGAQARRYPMRWLLDKILLQDAVDPDGHPAWTRLHQDDAIWFRLPQGLAYPIQLENMRYQIHLYARGRTTEGIDYRGEN